MSVSFTHLHVHSEFSLLDGACRIAEMCRAAADMGQTALAITDHGVMYGVIDFYKAAKKAGIKPIIGCEIYVSPRSMSDRVHGLDNENHHLVLLCKNEEGYKNLLKIVSLGFTDGFYVRPRVDGETLRKYSGGLIALSACLAGEVARKITADEYDAAKESALSMDEIFGRGNFYLELQDHGIPLQKKVNSGVRRLSGETGIPLVATNDAHYIKREDAYIQDVLLCIQTGKTLQSADRMKFETDEFYLKSGGEMAALFPENPEALQNTVKIADMCELELEFGKHRLPEYKLPQGVTDGFLYLSELSRKGFGKRYSDPPEEYAERLEMELGMIRRMGFVDYFLIVGDFISYAKDQGIPVGPGRGSAAGSIVSYCLGITDVDPMRFNLYFERFLNPERVTMPDIDIDFCVNRRSEVIEYVINKFGADHVAQIVTFGTMAARGAIRDVGRVMDVPYAEVDTVAKLVPFSVHMTVPRALETSKQLKELYNSDETLKKLLDTAAALEGIPRHASTHAAGVLITKDPVCEYVPLAKNDEAVVTQFPMGTLEELGLLKMDFLGLRNLTILDSAVKLVQKKEPGFSLSGIPDDDPAVFEMLTEGKTAGVFQLESAGMTSVCMRLRPQSVEDIAAVVALYRPGPMESIPRFIESKHNPNRVTYRHPALREILEVTYGCIVYQEQVLEIFRRLAGFSLGRADMVRRAISKKVYEKLKSERHNFVYGNEAEGIPGCVANDVDAGTAEAIFDEIMDFANYAFNKAHAAAYAVVAYQTAYMKRHYAKEYLAALLTSVLGDGGRVAEYIAVCRDSGIRVLPPDINKSSEVFGVDGGDIRFGLSAIKNIGDGFVRSVVAERGRDGPFRDFFDFCERMHGADLNRRAVESLAKAGAFDGLGANRREIIESADAIISNICDERRSVLEGQTGLFAESSHHSGYRMPSLPEYDPKFLMTMEKEVTGIYLSGHPMDAYREITRNAGLDRIHEIIGDLKGEDGGSRYKDNQTVTVAGIISKVRTKTTRNNTLMAYFTIEDEFASIELLGFSRLLERSGSYLKEDGAVVAKGRISLRDDKEPQIMADEVRPLSDYEAFPADGAPSEALRGENHARKRLYIKIPAGSDRFIKLRPLLNMFPGAAPITVFLEESGKRYACSGATDDTRLTDELIELFGDKNVVFK